MVSRELRADLCAACREGEETTPLPLPLHAGKFEEQNSHLAVDPALTRSTGNMLVMVDVRGAVRWGLKFFVAPEGKKGWFSCRA